jgi:hypothetical protein
MPRALVIIGTPMSVPSAMLIDTSVPNITSQIPVATQVGKVVVSVTLEIGLSIGLLSHWNTNSRGLESFGD